MTKALEVKQYVMDKFNAELTDETVRWGWWSRTTDRTNISIGDIEWDESEWGPMGRPNRPVRSEQFNIEVIIFVQKPGGTNEEAESAALEVFARMEEVFRADASLNGLATWCAFRPQRVGAGPYDGGSEALMVGALQVNIARI